MPDSGASSLPPDDGAAIAAIAAARERLLGELRRNIVGQSAVLELLVTCLFAGGHALFVGVPGLAKTLIVSSLAQALRLQFSRIQFAPDLMPGDITGTEVLEEDGGKRRFRFMPGPVFCNLLLADEINRTPPKTQAALLQAMQEHRVTAGGETHPLPDPFHVFATQNPIEQEGTYPLPEAQLDRFTLEIDVDYPDPTAELEIVARPPGDPAPLSPVIEPDELRRHQETIARIPVPDSVVAHVVAILRSSRPNDPSCPPAVRELVRFGAGPRAGQHLMQAARARAGLQGRPAVTSADVRELATAVLRHRLVRSFAAESRGTGPDEILARIVKHVDG